MAGYKTATWDIVLECVTDNSILPIQMYVNYYAD